MIQIETFVLHLQHVGADVVVYLYFDHKFMEIAHVDGLQSQAVLFAA